MFPKRKDYDSEEAYQEACESYMEKTVNKMVGGLKTKNEELLAKLSELKDLNAKFKDIDVDKLIEAQKELDELREKDNLKKGDYEKVIAQMKEQHEETITKLNNQISELKTTNQNMIVDSELNVALDSVKINPVLKPAAQRLLMGDVSVIEENGKSVAKVGDKNITDHVKDWANSDVGKNFILADDNQGGGGGKDKTKPDSDYEKHFQKGENYSVGKQTELYKKNPELYNQFKDKHMSSNQNG